MWRRSTTGSLGPTAEPETKPSPARLATPQPSTQRNCVQIEKHRGNAINPDSDQIYGTNFRRYLANGLPLRMSVYAALTALAMHATLLIVSRESLATLASENGPIEISQIVILLMSAILASISAFFTVHHRTVLFILASLMFCAAAREADDWFAEWFFDDSYKWFVCLPLLLASAYQSWKHRDTLYYESLGFLSRSSGTLIVFSMLMIATLCQTLDRTSFWPTIASNPSFGDQKSVIEEAAELFGYLLMLFGINELLVQSWQERRSEKLRLTWRSLISSALADTTWARHPSQEPTRLISDGEHPADHFAA